MADIYIFAIIGTLLGIILWCILEIISRKRGEGMKREEAIVHIKDIICESNSTKPNIVVFEQEKEALYMAIKALEREAKADEIPVHKVLPWESGKIIVPLTEAKIGQGHWINDKSIYKCTACNGLCLVAGWATSVPEEEMYKTFKYCPNCGAKMESEE